MSETKAEWGQVAEHETGDRGTPGSQFAYLQVCLYFRVAGERWRATALRRWGSNQGTLEEHGRRMTEGRGGTAESAVEAMRKDVLAWASDDEVLRAEYATALRKLVYAAEDAA